MADPRSRPALERFELASAAALCGLFSGMILLFVVAGFVADSGRPEAARLWTNIYGVVALGGGIVGLVRCARHRRASPEKRRFVRGATVGLLLWAGAQAVWLKECITDRPIPFPSIADVGYFVALLCWSYSFLQLYRHLNRPVLAEITPLLGVMVFLWTISSGAMWFIYRENSFSQLSSEVLVELVASTLYLCMSAVHATFIGALLLGPKLPETWSRSLKWAALGVLLDAVADLCFAVTSRLPDADLLHYQNGGWVDFVYAAGMLCWSMCLVFSPLAADEDDRLAAMP
jgi:hypothetical protein